MKYLVALNQTRTLDAREVEASSETEAEEKAYKTFHKFDRNAEGVFTSVEREEDDG